MLAKFVAIVKIGNLAARDAARPVHREYLKHLRTRRPRLPPLWHRSQLTRLSRLKLRRKRTPRGVRIRFTLHRAMFSRLKSQMLNRRQFLQPTRP